MPTRCHIHSVDIVAVSVTDTAAGVADGMAKYLICGMVVPWPLLWEQIRAIDASGSAVRVVGRASSRRSGNRAGCASE